MILHVVTSSSIRIIILHAWSSKFPTGICITPKYQFRVCRNPKTVTNEVTKRPIYDRQAPVQIRLYCAVRTEPASLFRPCGNDPSRSLDGSVNDRTRSRRVAAPAGAPTLSRARLKSHSASRWAIGESAPRSRAIWSRSSRAPGSTAAASPICRRPITIFRGTIRPCLPRCWTFPRRQHRTPRCARPFTPGSAPPPRARSGLMESDRALDSLFIARSGANRFPLRGIAL